METGPKKILVVEDDEILRSIIIEELSGKGHEVFEASNGKIALCVLEDYIPDLIITDIAMPEMDGLELLSYLGKKEPKHHIIAMTAGLTDRLTPQSGTEELLLKTADLLGATRTLVKPFKMDALLYLVDDIQ